MAMNKNLVAHVKCHSKISDQFTKAPFRSALFHVKKRPSAKLASAANRAPSLPLMRALGSLIDEITGESARAQAAGPRNCGGGIFISALDARARARAGQVFIVGSFARASERRF